MNSKFLMMPIFRSTKLSVAGGVHFIIILLYYPGEWKKLTGKQGAFYIFFYLVLDLL